MRTEQMGRFPANVPFVFPQPADRPFRQRTRSEDVAAHHSISMPRGRSFVQTKMRNSRNW